MNCPWLFTTNVPKANDIRIENGETRNKLHGSSTAGVRMHGSPPWIKNKSRLEINGEKQSCISSEAS